MQMRPVTWYHGVQKALRLQNIFPSAYSQAFNTSFLQLCRYSAKEDDIAHSSP